MTLALPVNAFEPARTLRRPIGKELARSGRSRLVGIAVTATAHLLLAAGLLFGITVARAPSAPKPIFVEIVKNTKKPDFKPMAPPKFVLPAQVSAPAPVIEIVPPPVPSAITVTTKLAPVPPPAAAAPAQTSAPVWNGQAGYVASLLAWLERYKQYPAAARSAHIEGVVLVHFVMLRDGTVRSAEIAQSSGRPVLDREALAMVQRAGKLPPMPPDMKGDTLDAVIGPINFKFDH